MGDGDSVREMQGTEVGTGGGGTPCSLSPGVARHTQGAPSPKQLAGEVVSATQHGDEIRNYNHTTSLSLLLVQDTFTVFIPKKVNT